MRRKAPKTKIKRVAARIRLLSIRKHDLVVSSSEDPELAGTSRMKLANVVALPVGWLIPA